MKDQMMKKSNFVFSSGQLEYEDTVMVRDMLIVGL